MQSLARPQQANLEARVQPYASRRRLGLRQRPTPQLPHQRDNRPNSPTVLHQDPHTPRFSCLEQGQHLDLLLKAFPAAKLLRRCHPDLRQPEIRRPDVHPGGEKRVQAAIPRAVRSRADRGVWHRLMPT